MASTINNFGKQSSSILPAEYKKDGIFRILSLDGGGAKGFYTLGVLRGIEGLLKCPLHECFDLVFGTSTGAIIATLIALGYKIEDIHQLYKIHVPIVTKCWTNRGRSKALAELAQKVFADNKVEDFKTRIGIVTARWINEKPMIFKNDITQAHGQKGTFEPFFGVSIANAVQASCSAIPLFERTTVTTSIGDKVELIDGGYCANNPTLYAIADAVSAMRKSYSELRVVSIGVGAYPKPNKILKKIINICSPGYKLLQKTLEINTHSIEQLRAILFKDVKTIRINNTYEKSEMATDFLEHNLDKLNLLRQRGCESFAEYEEGLRKLLISEIAVIK